MPNVANSSQAQILIGANLFFTFFFTFLGEEYNYMLWIGQDAYVTVNMAVKCELHRGER